MRIDERALVLRSLPDHPIHQPFAVEEQLADPTPDFSAWHDPSTESCRDAGSVWTPSSAAPTQDFALYIGSGLPHEDSYAAMVSRYSKGEVQVICIDPKLGGYNQDITLLAVLNAVLKLIRLPNCIAVVISLPLQSLVCPTLHHARPTYAI